MNELVKAFPDLFTWLIGILATGGLGLLIYFVKENIAVLKKLNTTVNGILIRFAAHEQSNVNIENRVEKVEGRVDRHCNEIEDIKLDVNSIKNKFEWYDKS